MSISRKCSLTLTPVSFIGCWWQTLIMDPHHICRKWIWKYLKWLKGWEVWRKGFLSLTRIRGSKRPEAWQLSRTRTGTALVLSLALLDISHWHSCPQFQQSCQKKPNDVASPYPIFWPYSCGWQYYQFCLHGVPCLKVWLLLNCKRPCLTVWLLLNKIALEFWQMMMSSSEKYVCMYVCVCL